jgi:hypothetical protein
MRSLAGFIMQGWGQAVAVTAAFPLLLLLLPVVLPGAWVQVIGLLFPLLWASGAAVALVGLRQGLQPGALVLVGAAAALTVVLFPILGNALPGVIIAVLLWLPVLVVAQILRTTVSLPLAVLGAGALGMLAVVLAYLALGDPAAWWQTQFSEAGLDRLIAGGGDLPEETLDFLTGILTGIMAVGLVLNWIASVLVGRWWQSLLYNPGGFRDEFLSLRLGRRAAWGVLALLVLSIATRSMLLANLLLPLTVVFALQGVAAIHGAMSRAGAGRGLVVGFYVLVLLFAAQAMEILAVLGVVDNWLDVRSRVKGGSR